MLSSFAATILTTSSSNAICHPCLNEHGQTVTIAVPSLPCDPQAWTDRLKVATAIPGGAVPDALNGVAFSPAALPDTAPTTLVAAPPYVLPPGLRAAAGVVIVEDDGRVWLVSPTNGFGGYTATFPKGRVDPGAGLQHTAVREAFEESGLLVEIVAFLVDVKRTQTFTRYYLARRIGGCPACMGWESQAVHLVPAQRLKEVATHANDAGIIAACLAARSSGV